MQRIDIFQIDAFTDKVFHGNPAVICLLKEKLNDELLQAIATENHLLETAFVLEIPTGFEIRWFTPKGEINLCGHATLAAAFVLFELGLWSTDKLHFSSLSGPLFVDKKGHRYTLDFPKLNFHSSSITHEISKLVDKPLLDVYESELDYLVIMAEEHQVMRAKVDLKALEKLPKRGLIITAVSQDADFYSRCFYPRYHISEDPVTGSAHCVLAPFWSDKLNKSNLRGVQGLLRKGEIFCKVEADRVHLSGYCKWYSRGQLLI